METLFKVKVDFVTWSETRFDTKTELIVTALTTAPMTTLLPDPIPASYPQRLDFTAGMAAYKAAVAAALDGGRTAVKKRQEERAKYAQLFKDFAPYLENQAKAANDISILTLSGYDRRRVPARPSNANGVPAAPVIFPRRGKVSGSVVTRVKPLLPGVRTYEGEYAVGDGAFQGRVSTNAGSRVTFTDLELAKLHQVRVRGIGPNGPGDWSDPVSIIVT